MFKSLRAASFWSSASSSSVLLYSRFRASSSSVLKAPNKLACRFFSPCSPTPLGFSVSVSRESSRCLTSAENSGVYRAGTTGPTNVAGGSSTTASSAFFLPFFLAAGAVNPSAGGTSSPSAGACIPLSCCCRVRASRSCARAWALSSGVLALLYASSRRATSLSIVSNVAPTTPLSPNFRLSAPACSWKPFSFSSSCSIFSSKPILVSRSPPFSASSRCCLACVSSLLWAWYWLKSACCAA